jgi:hypothetical protein
MVISTQAVVVVDHVGTILNTQDPELVEPVVAEKAVTVLEVLPQSTVHLIQAVVVAVLNNGIMADVLCLVLAVALVL